MLKQLRANVASDYKSKATETIRLYEDRKIKRIGTAEAILRGLAGKRKAPQTALDRISKYKQGPPATGEIARQRQNPVGVTEYFVKEAVQTITRYIVKKTQKMHPGIYKDDVPMGETIKAKVLGF